MIVKEIEGQRVDGCASGSCSRTYRRQSNRAKRPSSRTARLPSRPMNAACGKISNLCHLAGRLSYRPRPPQRKVRRIHVADLPHHPVRHPDRNRRRPTRQIESSPCKAARRPKPEATDRTRGIRSFRFWPAEQFAVTRVWRVTDTAIAPSNLKARATGPRLSRCLLYPDRLTNTSLPMCESIAGKTADLTKHDLHLTL